MIKKLFFTSLSVLLLYGSYGQAQNDKRWAVGPDFYALLDNGVVPKYNMFVRYKVGEKGAIRLRGGLNIYNITRQLVTYDDIDQKTYALRIGYERTKSLHKQVLFLHYGAEYVHLSDILVHFQHTTNTFFSIRHFENGGAAFIGCRYFILPALSVALESSFQLTRSHLDLVTTELPRVDGKESSLTDLTSVNIFPVNALTVCFHF